MKRKNKIKSTVDNLDKPVLVTPDLDKEMRVEADMSDFATGGVLSMKCEDERWRLVAYISKSLNKAERNYEIHDKEMLAIIQCLEAWKHFLEGAKDRFEIWTDHKNLEYFMKAQNVKFTNGGLSFSILFFIFMLFYFSIFFLFFSSLFLEQLGLRLIGHAVTSVTTWWHSHKTDHETWENLIEDSRTDNIIQHRHHMLTSWTTHGCLG